MTVLRAQRSIRRWIFQSVALGFALLMAWTSVAQDTPEGAAFRDAYKKYRDNIFDWAERDFASFVTTYPQSPMLPEAVLLQAQASLKMTNVTRTASLLQQHFDKAGPFADQYRYVIGQAQFQGGDFRAAADSFASVAQNFTNSALLLESSLGEAQARFQLREFDRVIALLQRPEGTFQRVSRTRPTNPWTVQGSLVLAQALHELRQFRAAEQTLLNIPDAALTPDLRWERQYLLCRLIHADGRPVEALSATTNLLSLAAAATQRGLLAESSELQGDLFKELNLPEAALRAYTNNLAEGISPERRRMAQLQIIEIKLAQEKFEEAARLLQDFLTAHPEDAASEMALLTTGELALRLHLSPVVAGTNGTNVASAPSALPPPGTNQLQRALGQFDRFLSTYTNSPLRGKALLNKGWCLWLDGRTADSVAAFKAAAETLPLSEDLAVARYKLGDAQFAQRDFTNALQSYLSVTNTFPALPRVREALADQALYQILRASVEVRDLATAQSAMTNLLLLAPYGALAERGQYLLGAGLLKVRQPASALPYFTNFGRTFPTSSLLPRVELAVARAYAQEDEWEQSINAFQAWIGKHSTNDLRPEADYSLARTYWLAGHETNALLAFTNFIATFPTNELAPRAQFWVGDYHMRQGDYVSAQFAFQTILTNSAWPVSRLTYETRLAAGRAAFARQGWKEAGGELGHFTILVNDVENCPPDIAAEALFALGDTLIRGETLTRPDRSPWPAIERYAEARKVFEKISPFSTNQVAGRLVPLAHGRIGDCSLQMAAQDPKLYEAATNAYQRVLTNALADSSTRALAEFGLARALESMADNPATGRTSPEGAALLQGAFEHYYNIVINDREVPDPIRLRDAGLAAARLKEEQRQWPVVITIYQRLQDQLPPLRAKLQDRIDRAREQLQRENN